MILLVTSTWAPMKNFVSTKAQLGCRGGHIFYFDHSCTDPLLQRGQLLFFYIGTKLKQMHWILPRNILPSPLIYFSCFVLYPWRNIFWNLPFFMHPRKEPCVFIDLYVRGPIMWVGFSWGKLNYCTEVYFDRWMINDIQYDYMSIGPQYKTLASLLNIL